MESQLMDRNGEICKKCKWLGNIGGDVDNWQPKSEEAKAMFKVGDRVRNKRNGDKGTVRAFKSGEYGIEYDTPNYTHELQSANLLVSCKENCGRWEEPDALELIPTLINIPARDAVAAALRECAEGYAKRFAVAVEAIERAGKPEEVMQAKKDLLKDIVGELPIDETDCYFCQLQGLGNGCEGCDYKKFHGGRCADEGSDYKKIADATHKLEDALSTYYSGESYADPERAEYMRLKAKFEG